MNEKQDTTYQRYPIVKGNYENFLENLKLLVMPLANIFGEHTEVVLHDLRKMEKSIVMIANGHITGRKVGDPIIGGPVNDEGLKVILQGLDEHQVLKSYISYAPDGRMLKSASVFFRNKEGKPLFALCINLDLSWFASASTLLKSILETKDSSANTEETELSISGGISSAVNTIVNDALSEIRKEIAPFSKAEKIKALTIMHERGLFLIRGGVEHAAKALKSSRYTIYNYLKELKLQP